MDTLTRYRSQALKLAEFVDLGDEGYAARIPGFRGLIATGATKKEAAADLQGALKDWIDLSLKRGLGLPRVARRERELTTAR